MPSTLRTAFVMLCTKLMTWLWMEPMRLLRPFRNPCMRFTPIPTQLTPMRWFVASLMQVMMELLTSAKMEAHRSRSAFQLAIAPAFAAAVSEMIRSMPAAIPSVIEVLMTVKASLVLVFMEVKVSESVFITQTPALEMPVLRMFQRSTRSSNASSMGRTTKT